MAFLDFITGKNPAQAAQPYLNQIPGLSNAFSGTYNKMAGQPVDVINEILASYKPSEGYKFREGQLNKSLGNTAAAGGFAGTENDQQQRAEFINALMSGDIQQFLDNVMGVQNRGLAGQERVADFQGNALNQQGGAAYQGQAQQNQNRTDLFRSLLNLLGAGGGFYNDYADRQQRQDFNQLNSNPGGNLPNYLRR